MVDPYYLKYYSDYEYFDNIINTIKNIRLTKRQESYLLSFVFYPHYSAYDIERNKKEQNEKENVVFDDNAYRYNKNIVRKLYELKLIELDKEKEEKSSKKKIYSLTDNGLFYILRSSTSRFYIQDMIRNYPNLKMFKDLLYPFIKIDTLRSENIPLNILNAFSLYLQQYCSDIENFIHYAKNKVDWQEEDSRSWNIEYVRNYLIDKYRYKWLENAETKENSEPFILKFFNNENKDREYIEIRIKDKTSGYLINKIQKKKKYKLPIPNIEHFLIKFHLSKEESIGRSFSNYYITRHSQFIFLLLSAFNSYTFVTSLLFSKDKNFIRSLEGAKIDFDNFYLAVKDPDKYSLESLIKEDLWELVYKKELAYRKELAY